MYVLSIVQLQEISLAIPSKVVTNSEGGGVSKGKGKLEFPDVWWGAGLKTKTFLRSTKIEDELLIVITWMVKQGSWQNKEIINYAHIKRDM